MSDQPNLRALIGQAVRDMATYKTPDVSNIQARLDAILRAAGKAGIAKDKLDLLHFDAGDLHIDSSWGTRGCLCSDQKRIPESVIDADDPLVAAKLWGSDKRIKYAKEKIWQATESIENYSMSLEELIAERREFDPAYPAEASPPLPQQGGKQIITEDHPRVLECMQRFEDEYKTEESIPHGSEKYFLAWDYFKAGFAAALPQAAVAPDGWKLVPVEPTPEIMAAAAVAAWPTASIADVGLAKKAARIALETMDTAPGVSLDMLASIMATMAPAYRSMIAAAPVAQALPVAAEKSDGFSVRFNLFKSEIPKLTNYSSSYGGTWDSDWCIAVDVHGDMNTTKLSVGTWLKEAVERGDTSNVRWHPTGASTTADYLAWAYLSDVKAAIAAMQVKP